MRSKRPCPHHAVSDAGSKSCALLAASMLCWQCVTDLQSSSHLWLILLPGHAGVVPFLEPVTPTCLDSQALCAMSGNSPSPCTLQGSLVKGVPETRCPHMLVQRTG